LNSEDFKGLVNYQDNYQEGSIRYEVGEHSNFILVPMLLAALHEVSSIGPEFIQHYTGELIKPMIDRLLDAGYRISSPPGRANHLFGIRLPEQVDADSLRDRLNKEKIVVSWRGDAMRVAPNVYNTQAEMDRFTQALLNEVRMGAL
jgi:selenocysteine lyase/cysteine desulfurase